MNDVILKTALNAVKPFLPGMIEKLDPAIHKFITDIELKPEEGEVRAIYALLVGADSQAYIVACMLNVEDRIIRSEAPILLTDFINNIIQKI